MSVKNSLIGHSRKINRSLAF
jgi:hypothetical protein